jgi:hypothetical protein
MEREAGRKLVWRRFIDGEEGKGLNFREVSVCRQTFAFIRLPSATIEVGCSISVIYGVFVIRVIDDIFVCSLEMWKLCIFALRFALFSMKAPNQNRELMMHLYHHCALVTQRTTCRIH